MKVLLLEDVRNVGKKGEVVEVSDGHALNFLIPQKKAQSATEAQAQQAQEQEVARESRQEEAQAQLMADIKKLHGESLTLSVKASEEGTLFASVSAQMLAEELNDQFDTSIESKHIVLADELKQTGAHEVTVQAGGAEGSITVTLESE